MGISWLDSWAGSPSFSWLDNWLYAPSFFHKFLGQKHVAHLVQVSRKVRVEIFHGSDHLILLSSRLAAEVLNKIMSFLPMMSQVLLCSEPVSMYKVVITNVMTGLQSPKLWPNWIFKIFTSGIGHCQKQFVKHNMKLRCDKTCLWVEYQANFTGIFLWETKKSSKMRVRLPLWDYVPILQTWILQKSQATKYFAIAKDMHRMGWSRKKRRCWQSGVLLRSARQRLLVVVQLPLGSTITCLEIFQTFSVPDFNKVFDTIELFIRLGIIKSMKSFLLKLKQDTERCWNFKNRMCKSCNNHPLLWPGSTKVKLHALSVNSWVMTLTILHAYM